MSHPSSKIQPNRSRNVRLDPIHRAVQCRRRAKKNYLSNAPQLAAPQPCQQTATDILSGAEAHLQSSRAYLREYVQSVVDVISIACEGPLIPELTLSSQRKTGNNNSSINSSPHPSDICRELGFLFQLTIGRPCRPIRQILEKKVIDKTVRSRARDLLKSVIEVPFTNLFIIGDKIINAFLRTIDEEDQQKHKRYRSALLLLLMYISDCHRYLYNNLRACNAAQFMRLISPKDPEASMRIAIAGAQLPTASTILHDNTTVDSKLFLFFHFCMFLANRNVPVHHTEAVVVHKFVSSCRLSLSTDYQSENDCQLAKFALQFIDVVWSCLTDSSLESTEKVRSDDFWTSFQATLRLNLNYGDFQFIVGSLMFLSYQKCGKSDKKTTTVDEKDEKSLNKGSDEHDIVDELLAKFILSLLRFNLKGIQSTIAYARRRRKNRRRSIQKKRKSNAVVCNNGNENQFQREEGLSCDILEKAFDLDSQVPSFGPLSFLCSFFSHRRNRHSISPLTLRTLSDVVLLLRENIEEINALLVISSTSKLSEHITEKLQTSNTSNDNCLSPALPEDIIFQHFNPSSSLPTLRNVVSHDIALASLLSSFANRSTNLQANNDDKRSNGIQGSSVHVLQRNNSNSDSAGILRQVLESMEKKTYESVAGQTSKRHLEAFSIQRAKETPEWAMTTNKESLSKVVALTIRYVRLVHLLKDLEQIHGGTMLHYAQQGKNTGPVKDNKKNEGRANEVQKNYQGQCGLGQKNRTEREAIKELSHGDGKSFLQEPITESDLELRAKKRRKLQGGFSFGSGTPIIPRDSHDPHDVRPHLNHTNSPPREEPSLRHHAGRVLSPPSRSDLWPAPTGPPQSKSGLPKEATKDLHMVRPKSGLNGMLREHDNNSMIQVSTQVGWKDRSIADYGQNRAVDALQDVLNGIFGGMKQSSGDSLAKGLSQALNDNQSSLSSPSEKINEAYWRHSPQDQETKRLQ